MHLTEVTFEGVAPIDGYGPGFFRVGGELFKGAVIANGATVSPWSGLQDPAPLLALAGQIDVLLCGMGDQIAHLPADLRAQLEAAGLGVEVMASPAAARTYNVLLSEGRRIAAALLPTA